MINLVKERTLKEEGLADFNDRKLMLVINRISIEETWAIGERLDFDSLYDLSLQVFYRIRGLGFLEELLNDPTINEIMINDINQVFVEKGGDLIKLDYGPEDSKEYHRIINKIVSKSGREVNLSNPIVDARLEDGSRVNIVLAPITKTQAVVTIRKFSKISLGMEMMIENGTLTKEGADFLKDLVKAKYNILISGGTSSGKTSFLNALSEYIDSNERIITIEDSRELRLIDKNNLISLETRNPNNSNRGLIDLKDLIKTSLRMRPDRIIVGEVRSSEAIDMLMALNTGHDGGMTTAHANSCRDMISRLETMVLRAGENIPLEAVKRMIASSIDIIIQLSRLEDRKRRVVEISELEYRDGEIRLNCLYKYDIKNDQLIRTEHEMINIGKLDQYHGT